MKMKKISPIYSFKGFSDETHTKKGIILRHDVDFSIDKAYELFKVEKELNVKSTYFILVTCDYYNPLSRSNKIKLREMNDKGSEIGLHFDPTIYGKVNNKSLCNYAKNEAEILEEIIGNKVTSISLHNPSIHNQYPSFSDFINAYDSPYFDPEFYFSDSCMDFRGKNIYDFIHKARENLVQILFHPIHFTKEGKGYLEIFSEILEDHICKLDNTLIKYNRGYRNASKLDSIYNYLLRG
ncbi:hypothetical protein GN156_05560 [bacterium LRH843]|nr:hypothetical protein [bacterium LRH843]